MGLEFFHVTLKGNLDSIFQHGLIPSAGERSRRIAGERNGVYLFPDKSDVSDALYNWLGEELPENEEIAILQIDLPDDFGGICKPGENGAALYEAYSVNAIPAMYITAVFSENMKLLLNRTEAV